MDMKIRQVCEDTASMQPIDRLAAIAQETQDIYDGCLPEPPAALAQRVKTRLTRFEFMRRTVDKWTEATAEARDRYLEITRQATAYQGSHACRGAPTYAIAVYMKAPPPIYARLFTGKTAKQPKDITAMWTDPSIADSPRL